MTIIHPVVLLTGTALLAAITPCDGADESSAWKRGGWEEVLVAGKFLAGDTVAVSAPTVSLRIDDFLTGGLQAAYHFNNHFSLNFEAMGGTTEFVPEVPAEGLAGDALVITGGLNVEYNILRRRLTPFVSAGVGVAYFDTDGVQGYPGDSEISLTYSWGAGLRWDVNERILVKLLGGQTWVHLSDTDRDPSFTYVTLAFGTTF